MLPTSSTPVEAASEIDRLVSRLRAVLDDKSQRQLLLRCREEGAQKLLDSFQQLLYTYGLDLTFKKSLIIATQRLSHKSGLFPACYHLNDVDYPNRPVATGGFADVYKGSCRGRPVCIKLIRVYQRSQAEHYLKKCSNEALLWGQLSHPNICPIYGLFRHDSQICLVSPWMDNGDLREYLKGNPKANRLLLVRDAAQGLSYLHDNEIIHGDLKGANILVSASGRARLTDFGLSSVSDPDILAWTSQSSAESKGGTVRWQAPELFDFENDKTVPNRKASDIYAWSCACYEAFTGEVPFADLQLDGTVMFQVMSGRRPSRPAASSISWSAWGLTENIWSIMTDCWRAEPSSRPTVHQIIGSLSQGLCEDQRSADETSILSPSQFREEIGARTGLISVDELEMLMEIHPFPPSLEVAPNSDSPVESRNVLNLHDDPIIQALFDTTVQELEAVALEILEQRASAYFNEKKLKEAERLQIALMEWLKQKLGDDHSRTLTTMTNLARTYSSLGRQQEAEVLRVAVSERRVRT